MAVFRLRAKYDRSIGGNLGDINPSPMRIQLADQLLITSKNGGFNQL